MNLPFEGSLALRRRSAWEAADAGLLLWRENFVWFLPFFALPVWVCAFCLRLLPNRFTVWPWLILWLLKPLFDRFVLHVISVRFFEGGADMRRLFRGLGRTLRRGLAGDLLWRRFSPLRAAMMPVRALESPGFGKTAGRRQILKKGGLGFCTLLTVWGMALEVMLLGGEAIFCVIMIEIIQPDYIFSFNEFMANGKIFIFYAWCINYIVVESLYVCMGFGVYLNSRVEVEGWDIEIMFRSFAEKNKSKITAVIIIFCISCGIISPISGYADDSIKSDTTNQIEQIDGSVPLETLQKVLDSPDFGGERDGWGIRLKKPLSQKAPEIDLAPWLETIRQIFAFILRFVVIALIAAAAVFLFLYLRKMRGERVTPKGNRNIRGLREMGEKSPELLLEKAEFFYKQGNLRLAWGFCVAAAIRSWTVYQGLQFPPNATEYDCFELVRAGKMTHNTVTAFAVLINNWVNLAYGGRIPAGGSFEEAVAFCRSLRDKWAND